MPLTRRHMIPRPNFGLQLSLKSNRILNKVRRQSIITFIFLVGFSYSSTHPLSTITKIGCFPFLHPASSNTTLSTKFLVSPIFVFSQRKTRLNAIAYVNLVSFFAFVFCLCLLNIQAEESIAEEI